MYKIYLKRGNTSRNIFEPYSEEVISENIETGKPEINNVEWTTDDLVQLAEKYKELLKTYNTQTVRAVEELDTEIMVDIIDN